MHSTRHVANVVEAYWRLWIVMVAALLAAAPLEAQDQTAVEATGINAGRAYVSVLPWESIDVYSGSLVLTATDLVLPGNAGFDLTVTRVYNSKRVAGWRIGPGMIRYADAGSPGAHSGYNPLVVSADGGEHATFQAAAGSAIYRTLAYAQYDRSAHILSLPNGVTYRYECHWNPQASGYPNQRFPTTASDAFGNALTFTYEPEVCDPAQLEPPKLKKITQTLGPGQQREVTFDYLDGRLRTMRYGDRVWTYTWVGDLLTDVQPPVGGPWHYDYTGRLVNRVTTPNGGQVTYRIESQGGRGASNVVLERKSVALRQVPEGTWTFNYFGDTVTVTSPLNTAVYTFDTDGTREGSLERRETKTSTGAVLETEELTWRDSVRVGLDGHYSENISYAYGPLLASRAVTRGPATPSWSTTYWYHEDYFNDFGQPWRIVETGDFTRTTDREFWDSATQYIHRQIRKVTVTGDGASFESSTERDNDGFQLSKTVNGLTVTFGRGEFGNASWAKDAKDQVTYYQEYAWSLPEKVVAPEHTTTRKVNDDGSVQWEHRDQYTQKFTYVLGRETMRRLYQADTDVPIGNGISTDYDANGCSVTTSRGNAWSRTDLDGFGRTVGTEDSAGVKSTVGYNAWGGRSYDGYPYTTTDIGTAITYDELGRVKRRTNPDNTSAQYEYDGLRVTITDENGHVTVQQWEASGDPSRARLKSVTEPETDPDTPPAARTTSYAYDVLDTLVGVTHPNGTTRRWQYNVKHQLELESHPESGQVLYTYDAVGNVETRTDAEGKVLRYFYDGENRLTDIKVGDSGWTPDDVRFAYDGWGNRSLAENAYVKRAFTFEAARLVRSDDSIRPSASGAWWATSTEYGYDGNDNVTWIRYPSGPQRTTRYDYDDHNRMTKVYESGGATYASEFSYHPSGAIESYKSGNGIVNTIEFNEPHQRYWPRHITAGSVLSLTYEYDNVGNVLSITGAPSGAQAFGYDALDRLTSFTKPWEAETYHYDAVGNRDWKEAGARTDYMYSGNRLTTTTGAEAETFGYDNAGNLTVDGAGVYTYTAFDMMQTALVNNQLSTYRYDADRLRAVTTASAVHHYSLRGVGSQVLSEVKEDGGVRTWQLDYIYAGTRLVAGVRPPTGSLALAVQKAGGGTGLVTSAPAGIQCGATCSATYAGGTIVTLTAIPDPGWRFAGWSGDADCADGVVAMNASKTCTATFVVQMRTLWITTAGPGTGRVTRSGLTDCRGVCPGSYPDGTVVSLRAIEDPGSLFAGWSGDCSAVSMGTTVTMNGDRACTATFLTPVPRFTALTPPSGAALQGNVAQLAWNVVPEAQMYWYCVAPTPAVACATWWVATETSTTALVANLAPGLYYWQAKVQVPSGRYDADGGTWKTFTVPETAATLTVAAVSNASGSGRILMPDGVECRGTCTAAYGSGAAIEIWGLPDFGSMLVGWSGDCSARNYRQPLTMSADRSCTATFAPAPAGSKRSPADGTAVASSSVLLEWDAVAGATYYYVCLADTPITTACPTGFRGTTASSLLWDGVVPGEHYWQVRVDGAAGRFDLNGVSWGFAFPLPADHWKAEYFANQTLAGSPARVVDEGTGFVDHSWGTGGPAGLPTDNFSARFTRTVTFAADQYRFILTSDDGGRLWVDDQLVIDAWSGPPLTPRTADLILSGGPHTLRYEYVEQTGGATARLTWERLTPVVLASGAPLWPGESRTSIDGRYRMQYQDDGNLVVVRLADDTCAWASWTNNTSAGVVVMQDDGNFVVYDGGGVGIWNAGTWGHPGAWLEIVNDQMVIVAPDGTPLWVVSLLPPADAPVAAASALPPAGSSFGRLRGGPGPESTAAGSIALGVLALAGLVAWRTCGRRRPRLQATALLLPLLLLVPTTALAQSGTEVVEYYHLDALGSVRAITDASGVLLRQHDFKPFGEEIRDGNGQIDLGDRKLFTGQERDTATGLDYFAARHYQPSSGRFLSPDPIRATRGRLIDPQQLARYGYARNNPLKFIDALGLTISFGGNSARDSSRSQQLFDAYVAYLEQDPKKYAAEIVAVCLLRLSEINYVVDATTTAGSAEGGVIPDAAGNNILVNIRNIGGSSGETMDLNGRFAHELEHARQFDAGEMAFARGPRGWTTLFYDLTDEARAFTAQLNVSRLVVDSSLLKNLRAAGPDGIVNFLDAMNYNGLRGRTSPRNFSVPGATPGTILRTPNLWGVVHW